MTLQTMPSQLLFRLSPSSLVVALTLCTGLVACGSGGGDGAPPVPPPSPSLQHVYIASTGDDKIYIYDFNPSTGKLTANGTVKTGRSPQQIAFHPSHQFAYVANQLDHNVSMYRVNPTTGALTPLDDPRFPGVPLTVLAGGNPTDIAVDPLGRFAYTANEATASISSFRIDGTGALSPIETSVPVGGPDSTETFHVTVDPTGSFVYATAGDGTVPHTGDAIHAFSIDPGNGKLTSLGTTPAPAIAVHVATHPDKAKPFVYLASGINNMVTTYEVTTPSGPLTQVGSSLNSGGIGPRAVAVERSGKFAYVANIGDHTVTAFSINQGTGALTSLSLAYLVPNDGGRFLAIDPSGQFLYATSNAVASSVTVFHIDSQKGELKELDTALSAGTGSVGVTVFAAP